MKKVGQLLVVLLFTFCLTPGCRAPEEASSSVAAEAPGPNIVFILADDLGYGDLSFTGQQYFQTPNIDQLAREGMFFQQHYAGSTVCAPSRSALLTGLHTGHTSIRGNREIRPEGQYPLDSSLLTVAELLQSAGYVTGAFGKWGLGYPGSTGDPNQQGFNEFYGYNCQRLGHNYYPYHLWHNQTRVALPGNADKGTATYAPDIIHQQALDFIKEHKDTSFFLYYPSIIPHAELLIPDSLREKYYDKFLPDPAYVGVDDGPRYRNGPYGSQERPRAAFAAMVALLDKQVGEIRATLAEHGLAENTLIVFTSDNGPHVEGGADPDYFDSNARFKGYKRDLYEGGVRVPLIVHWPGKVQPATTSDHISAFWDFLPTVCALIDTPPPAGIDGISFLPELLGKPQAKHDYLYWEFHARGGKQAVRKDEWKGIRLNMSADPEAPIALYNLATDPGETQDVAAEHPEIVAEITAIMQKAHTPSDVFRFDYEE